MKALIFRLVGLLAALLITGLSLATTAYADNGGGPTHPPTPMSTSY
ncbi:hypothetical protein JZ785_25950 [Alicyclobacillus curvatus]|jgi:hypothetical protein|nr:hypothetical protein JZ785_25950 [Alicyclobacillus curvatus]